MSVPASQCDGPRRWSTRLLGLETGTARRSTGRKPEVLEQLLIKRWVDLQACRKFQLRMKLMVVAEIETQCQRRLQQEKL